MTTLHSETTAEQQTECSTGDTIDVDQFVGAELDRYRAELSTMMQHANYSVDVDPIVHVHTNSAVGAEALARFPGEQSTARWFQLAHALGIGPDLEMAILDAVIAEASELTYGFIGVNLSPAVLVDPRCIERLAAMDDDRLVIEITDQTTIPELGLLHMHLDQIRNAGVRIATHVSDFGPDALRSFRRLSPDIVKVNPSLTAALAAGETESADTARFLEGCRREGAFVVAVGVERADQLPALVAQQVDAYQGYLARDRYCAA